MLLLAAVIGGIFLAKRDGRDGRRRMIRVIVGTVLATVFVIGLGMIGLAAAARAR